MHRGQRSTWMLTGLLFVSPAAWAQEREPNALGCALCGSLIFIPIGIIVLDIALLVWVARDAKSRGMDSAVIWMLLVMFTSVIGLVIYILSRPQGNLIQCPSCNNQRLQASAKCPHCGNA
jgi:Phospholipase_D-nuclease N-terminal